MITNIVSFPELNLEFTIPETLGKTNIHWYGVIIAVGFLLAIIYAMCRAKTFGIISDKVIDVAIFGTIGGIVGARAYYVIFHFDSFKDNLLSIFEIWNGGIAIYGGIIGGLLVGALACKLYKVKVLPMIDLAVLGYLIGQGIGRWGNFVNGEAYGADMVKILPWGMQITEVYNGSVLGQTSIVHPCFLYESLWCILGFVVLHFYSKHRKFDGEILLMYLAWYGLERFFVEGLRTDSLYIPNTEIRVSQLVAAVCVVVATTLWIIIRVKIKGKTNLVYGNTTQAQDLIKEYEETEKNKKKTKKEEQENG